MNWTTDSKHLRKISSPRSRIGPICFAEFDFNAPGAPGRRFTRKEKRCVVVRRTLCPRAELMKRARATNVTSAAGSNRVILESQPPRW